MRRLAALTPLLGLLLGCGEAPSPPAGTQIALVHLQHHPEATAATLPRPDLLILHGVDPATWTDIRDRFLEESRYEEAFLGPHGPGPGLAASAEPGRTAILSSTPCEEIIAVTNLTFSIEGDPFRPSHPPVRVVTRTASGQALRLWSVHLHPKTWHPSAQHEVRRNEARLAWQEIRRDAEAHPDAWLVVAATLNDDPGSAAADYFTDGSIPGLTDLRPQAADGSAWTRFDAETDQWMRHDALFVRPPAGQPLPQARLDPAPIAAGRRVLRAIWP